MIVARFGYEKNLIHGEMLIGKPIEIEINGHWAALFGDIRHPFVTEPRVPQCPWNTRFMHVDIEDKQQQNTQLHECECAVNSQCSAERVNVLLSEFASGGNAAINK